MHAVARRALHTPNSLYLRPPCRLVAGVRHPSARNLHQTAIARRAPEDGKTNEENESPKEKISQLGADGEAEGGVESKADSEDAAQRLARRRDYGSGLRRANRSRQSPSLPPLVLPDWFLSRNVWCYGYEEPGRRRHDGFRIVELDRGFDRKVIESRYNPVTVEEILKEVEFDDEVVTTVRESIEKFATPSTPHRFPEHPNEHFDRHIYELIKNKSLQDTGSSGDKPQSRNIRDFVQFLYPQLFHVYNLRSEIFSEIRSSFRADLTLPSPTASIKDVYKPDTHLICPSDGNTFFLDSVVEFAVSSLGCDLIRFDAEDLAQIVGGYLGENVAWTTASTALLGYESQRAGDMSEMALSPELAMEKHTFLLEEESFSKYSIKNSDLHEQDAIVTLRDHSRSRAGQDYSKGISLVNFLSQPGNLEYPTSQPATSSDAWNEYKIGRALETIVDASVAKLANNAKYQQDFINDKSPERRLVVQIIGYKELCEHPLGSKIIKKLQEIVKKRWYEGKSIMIVGTTDGKDDVEPLKHVHDSIGNQLTTDLGYDRTRTITIPPGGSSQTYRDRRLRTRLINIRRVEHMIRSLLNVNQNPHRIVDLSQDLEFNEAMANEVELFMWDYMRVRKVALAIIGSTDLDKELYGPAFVEALNSIDESDHVKLTWARNPENGDGGWQSVRKFSGGRGDTGEAKTAGEKERAKEKEIAREKRKNMEELEQSCNRHEKQLLGGVIDPADLHTTFQDIRAPKETIEALKTLTSMSLIRPDSFSYGVLATDKIPGLLLYGPPGTGKTLLAKAVAKESGATMLEVSSSEINDMYVGESEKNVKAVFTLAAKLSPCVIFIDEADALFGARGDMGKRRNHRELVNQFLREWDGMSGRSAFLMVATNRPFDLDDAALRRLPRRLLVDLPTEADRAAILKIHLADELLDESVDLTALARDSPLYSGSDLKNVAVAAALACVRDENEAAAKHVGAELYEYPKRRVLTKNHFDQAMGEISASISRDMGTLAGIRKFDERYGDRKGRRKERVLGFGGTGGEPDEGAKEEGRVRKAVE